MDYVGSVFLILAGLALCIIPFFLQHFGMALVPALVGLSFLVLGGITLHDKLKAVRGKKNTS